MFSKFFEFTGVANNSDIKNIEAFLKCCGGATFLNGLYRIHNFEDIAKWTNIVGEAFPEFQGDLLVFSYDWLGRHFGLNLKRNTVLIFEPGTGEVLDTESDFLSFHNEEIVEYHNDCLASEFFDTWYKANQHFLLPHDKCAGYRIPLFLNGDDTIDNLEVSDMEVYWGITGQLIP